MSRYAVHLVPNDQLELYLNGFEVDVLNKLIHRAKRPEGARLVSNHQEPMGFDIVYRVVWEEKETMSESEPKVALRTITKRDVIVMLENVKDEEPLFVLRAQDILAPEIVREWAHRARAALVPPEKIVSAMNVADAMEEWQVKKVPD